MIDRSERDFVMIFFDSLYLQQLFLVPTDSSRNDFEIGVKLVELFVFTENSQEDRGGQAPVEFRDLRKLASVLIIWDSFRHGGGGAFNF